MTGKKVTMSELKRRDNYVQKEMEKIKENYDVPLIQEFHLKLLFQTQYDLENIDTGHTKTRRDLVEIYQKLHRDAFSKLKPKVKQKLDEKRRVFFLLDHREQVKYLSEILHLATDYSKNIKAWHTDGSNREFTIETENAVITIAAGSGEYLKGRRADVFYKLEDITRDFI